MTSFRASAMPCPVTRFVLPTPAPVSANISRFDLLFLGCFLGLLCRVLRVGRGVLAAIGGTRCRVRRVGGFVRGSLCVIRPGGRWWDDRGLFAPGERGHEDNYDNRLVHLSSPGYLPESRAVTTCEC